MAKELKLNAKAIRKILNENNMDKPGKKNVPLVHNRICYGYGTQTTGMIIRNIIKGEIIQIWALTDKPGADIERASELLKEAGYSVETKGFQCLVKLPKEN